MSRNRGTGELLVDGIALGVCGTDREIAAGELAGRRRDRSG
jgi:threonine dehydrogenase-like Zn-dependent dehydrogenase